MGDDEDGKSPITPCCNAVRRKIYCIRELVLDGIFSVQGMEY